MDSLHEKLIEGYEDESFGTELRVHPPDHGDIEEEKEAGKRHNTVRFAPSPPPRNTNNEERKRTNFFPSPRNRLNARGTSVKSSRQSSFDFNVEVLEGDRYDDASIFLLEGQYNYKFEIHPSTNVARKAFLRIHSPLYARTELFFSLLLLLITAFEYPAVVKVPLYYPLIVEIICFLFLVWNFRMRALACGGWDIYFADAGRILRVLVLLVVVIDCLLYVATNTLLRPLRLFRPFFLINSLYASSVRRVLRQMAQSFVVIFDMMLFLLFFIAIWATMGFYLFSHHGTDPYFSSFELSFTHLFVLVTTANYPDIMMPAFDRNRASPIFFVCYLLLGLYFLLYVFLAMVFNSFHEKEKEKYRRMYIHKRTSLRFAYFGALDPVTSGVTFSGFADMFRHMMGKSKKLSLCFLSLNKSKTGVLTLEEFYDAFEALKLTWKLDKDMTLGTNANMTIYFSKFSPPVRQFFYGLKRIAESIFFELVFDIVILVNCFLLMLMAYLSGDDNNVTRSQPFELFFAMIYVFETCFKILAFGPKLYFSKSWNRFDFFVTVVIVVLMIVDFVTHLGSLGAIGLFLRSVRLVRFFKLRRNLRGVLLSMGKLVPGLGRFFVTVALVYYAFAIIGMTAFNNTVSRCTPDVCGSDYDNQTGFYQLNNFDNILFSYNTMFELMVVNNWYVTMEGHVAMTNPASRLFFMIFYLFAVLLVVNVVIAFILDSFGAIFPTIRELKLSDHVEKGESVAVPMSLAKRAFPSDDPDLQLPVDTLYYYAPHRIGKADIYHTLFEEEIDKWIEQDNVARGINTDSHHQVEVPNDPLYKVEPGEGEKLSQRRPTVTERMISTIKEVYTSPDPETTLDFSEA